MKGISVNPGIDEATVRETLSTVIDPVTGQDIVAAGLVSGIVLRPRRIGFQLAVTAETRAAREPLAEASRQALLALPGIESVTPVLTAEVAAAPSPRAKAQWHSDAVPGITRILAVASGKGGVGKSSVAVSLAHAFTAAGLRVGLLDADIHGPSLPRMLGTSEKPSADGGRLRPVMAQGIACLSTGLLIEEGQAAVLRGPMVGKTLQQFLRGADWGTLDLLIIDLPPGTGDIHLSLAQSVPLGLNGGGAILVTTPQAVALADARKAANMFQKIGVPILGVIENMSWLEASDGLRTLVFGEGGGQTLACETGSPLLAQLPLDPAFGAALDQGKKPPMDAFSRIANELRALWHEAPLPVMVAP